MPDKGHIELERQIDSITVGVRHRRDLGDMTALMRSIEEVGLLQPITVTPDGVLVCGLRRLEAMRRLGKRTLSVWVRSGISDQLSHLLAQQDENEQRKPLSPVETARLYDEIKVLEKEDSQRRQAVTRFGRNGSDGDMNGGDESPPPRGKTRSIAAHILTGTDASQRLERINWIRSISEDNSLGESVREFAANMLSEIDNDAPVSPAYKRVKAAVELASKPPPPAKEEQDEVVTRLAAEALKRVQEEENAKRPGALRNKAKRAPRHHSPRSFSLMWSELEGWTELYDVNELAGALKDDEWARFERVVTESIDLRDRLRDARTAAASA
jgi:ParB family chromosome partitioning protein